MDRTGIFGSVEWLSPVIGIPAVAELFFEALGQIFGELVLGDSALDVAMVEVS